MLSFVKIACLELLYYYYVLQNVNLTKHQNNSSVAGS